MLFGVNDFAGALIKFSRAHDSSKDVRLLWQMGACQAKLHHYAKALGLIRSYLKDGGTLLTDQDRSDADAAVKAMEPLTSTVDLKAPETGAEVIFDDESVGMTPMESMLVDIGVHKIRIHKDGFKDFVSDVTVTGNAHVPVEAMLSPIVHEGKVHVRAGEKDAITVDGEPVGVGTWSGTLKSGGHTLRVTGADDMLPYQTEVLLEDDQNRNIDVTLNPKPHTGVPAWAWIVGGVVVAGGLGTGGYFLFRQGGPFNPNAQYTGPAGNLGNGIAYASAGGVKF
jgi:hypothetical protein